MKKTDKKKKPVPVPATFPMRINRYLALKNYSTRRGADVLIESGKVKINGVQAKLGDHVKSKDDVVEVTGIGEKKYVYLAYYKPRGIVTTTPQPGGKSIEDIFRYPSTRVFPIGRLDKESEGLILLTNDGRITKRILDPEYEHEKEYEVVVNKPLSDSFENKMSKPVVLEDFTTRESEVEIIDESEFRIVLTEGKKHQIRRMCTKFGYEVRSLKRVRIMSIELGNLKEGQHREVTGKELETFLKKIGLNKTPN